MHRTRGEMILLTHTLQQSQDVGTQNFILIGPRHQQVFMMIILLALHVDLNGFNGNFTRFRYSDSPTS